MRALTVEELGFVSGGGTPLAQQAEQAAWDNWQSDVNKSLAAMGITGFAAGVVADGLAWIAKQGIGREAQLTAISGLFRAIGHTLTGGALIIAATLLPTPANAGEVTWGPNGPL